MGRKFDDDLKVLCYGDLNKLKSNMTLHFLKQLEEVSDEMTQEPRNVRELNNYVMEGNFTHVIIPDEWFDKLDGSFENCEVPVVELLGDHWIPWAIDKKRDYIKRKGFEDAFVFSNRFQNPYSDLIDMHTVLHGFDSEIFTDKKEERAIDILIHGSLGEDTYKWVYPVRNWLANVLPEIGIKEGLKVERWEHPGYWTEGENVGKDFARDYANIINKSKIAIGGSSYWRLPLMKFYEVPACGTILLSDLPLENTEFFKNRIIEVNPKRINEESYEDVLRREIVNVLEKYDTAKNVLQPFRDEEDRFNQSYRGRALEMRAILSKIK